jgi:uncharacterized protein YkwD
MDCAPLAADPELAVMAAEHSTAMMSAGHSTAMRELDGGGRVASDGLPVLDLAGRTAMTAAGVNDPAAVVAGWLDDPGDRAALLDCSLTIAGVGVAGGSWWTLLST